MLLIGIQKIKKSAKESLVIASLVPILLGARSGDSVITYTVFRKPIANMSWSSVNKIRKFSEISGLFRFHWEILIVDTSVVGTSRDYFKHHQYGKKVTYSSKRHSFNHIFSVVLGAEVAKKLGYTLNDRLYLSHGLAKGNLPLHKNTPFHVVGILNPTEHLSIKRFILHLKE